MISSLKEVVLLDRRSPSASELRAYRDSNELSSPSPEEPPRTKVAPFFFGRGAPVARGEALRMGWGRGARLTLDRLEREIWSLEKPRTMLVELISVEGLSAVTILGLMSETSLSAWVAMVEVEDSGARAAAVMGCEGWGS